MSKTLDFSKDKELIRQDSAGEYIEVTLNVKKAFGKGRLYNDGSMLIEKGHYVECKNSADEGFRKRYRSDFDLNIESDGDVANIKTNSISGAANILVGGLSSGYTVWKDKKGRTVEFYKDTANEDVKTTKKRVVAEVLDYKPRNKNIGSKGEPLETLVNPDVKQILGDKVHLEECDELTWYRDANVKITWHTDGTCDLFEKEHVAICGAVFRVSKGYWKPKDEHGVGMEPQHWIYKNIKVSDILKVYPNFWKACENNDNRSYEISMTRSKEKEAVDKEEETVGKEVEANVRKPRYYYESLMLRQKGKEYENVACSALRSKGSLNSDYFNDKVCEQDTPWKIVEDMIDLLPESVWNVRTKFLDIYCKSGIFLEVIKNTLKDKCYEQYKELGLTTDKEINKYIFNNQIYGLCWSDRNYEYTAESLFMVKCPMNSFNIKKLSEIIGSDKDSELVKDEHFGNADGYIKVQGIIDKLIEIYGEKGMKIDVVVGNPPYNNDLYIPFVEMGHKISNDYSIFITPAKWQAKGDNASDKPNERFRKSIVPHMSKIVMYRDTHDIFDIDDNAGMSYYIIDKENHYKNWNVKGVCTKNSVFNFDWEIHNEDALTLYSNKVISIINKCKSDNMIANKLDFKRCIYVGEQERGKQTKTHDTDVDVMQGNKHVGFMPISQLKTTANIDKYKVTCAIMIGGAVMFNNDSKILGSASYTHVDPNQVLKGSFPCIRYFDTEDECKSFESYLMTKLMGFLFFLGICGATMTNNFFIYIPDQDKFDHIFTDAELYRKYNLTQDEINIIESVIKERK